MGSGRRSLPDPEVLTRLLLRHGDAWVAAEYGVTKQAVSNAKKQGNIDVNRRISYKEYIPWRVKAEHANTYIHMMLRLYARDKMALGMSPKERTQLTEFLAELTANNWVVNYDPSIVPPWHTTNRRPDIDKGIIREPTVPPVPEQ